MLVPFLLTILWYLLTYWTQWVSFPLSSETGKTFSTFLALVELAAFSSIAGYLACLLNHAGIRTRPSHQSKHVFMPLYSTLLFMAIVAASRWGGWVPIELGVILAFPCILLPPLTYRVMHFQQEQAEPDLFSIEETCRTKDAARASSLVQQFLERYPNCKVYLYRNHLPHSAGGLLFHNRERLSVPYPTHLEVTLNCPFTTKLGVFAEGRELFRAYLNRLRPEGSIIQTLPQQNWEEWLIGITKREWFNHITELDTKSTTHPNTNGLPYQFQEHSWPWEQIDLT